MGNPTTIVSAGQKPNLTSWTFQYTAPDPAVGPVTLYLAAVDGNGANSPPTKTLTDPFGDDVFVATVTLQPSGMASREPDFRGALACLVSVVVLGGARRRGRRGPSHDRSGEQDPSR
jgi:hypothetical protein